MRGWVCNILYNCFWALPEQFVLNKVEVPTVSWPVCLGVRHPSGTHDQFFFLLEISFRQFRVCYFVAPSLMRGRVCNILYNCFWALPEQSLLGRSPDQLGYILLSHLRLPQLGGPGPHIYIPQEQSVPVIPPGTGFPFVASYDSQGCGGGILTPTTRVWT
jgi:hypothetical protein